MPLILAAKACHTGLTVCSALETSLPQEQQQHHQQRFEAISLDLDEEALGQLRRMLPSKDDTNGSRRPPRESSNTVDCVAVECDSHERPGNTEEDPAPSCIPRSIWGALGLDLLLKVASPCLANA